MLSELTKVPKAIYRFAVEVTLSCKHWKIDKVSMILIVLDVESLTMSMVLSPGLFMQPMKPDIGPATVDSIANSSTYIE